ncbi:TonB-dependent receptor plug domain-containing protein [Roseateles sp. DB2]|uniref:TonB-dependent receptor plug domain-containing protein n=1 Tax=Roseateles sp. DB2 TaxID=3453717 RepID=UPI003EF06882
MGLAMALAAPCAHAADSSKTLDKVEVSGAASSDRKDASAAKTTVSAAELNRFGDASLVDALQRIPGLSVERSSSKGAVVSLRGLGSGYTQLLLNGDPMPQGFSIDSIAPQLIERIEVLRTATSDMSNQAIAGTINIVLKQTSLKRRGELKLAAGHYEKQFSPSFTVDRSMGSERFSYGIGAGLADLRDRWPSSSVTQSTVLGSTQPQRFQNDSSEWRRERRLNLMPSATWKPGDQQALTLNGLLQRSWTDFEAPDVRTALAGDPVLFPIDRLVTSQRADQLRVSGAWKSPVGESARIEAKASHSAVTRTTRSNFYATAADASLLLSRDVGSTLRDRSTLLSGKYSHGLSSDHALAFGWDAEFGQRAESRDQTERSPVGLPTQDLSESYTARISRLAVFAQDEWELSRQVSAYLGLRHESLSTETVGNVLDAVHSRSSALSPTAQLLWRLPDTRGDQVRLSVAHTFKTPTARELIPRRWVVNQNSATSPNFQGNPNLRPEEAWGLDLGYERHLRGDAFLGVNVFARRIRSVVLNRVQFVDGAWMEVPVNSGNAKVLGLELEAKGKLRQFLSTDADVDLRTQVARYWSALSALSGPGNRLSRQPPLTASLSADWRPAGSPLTLGSSLVFRQEALVRMSPEQTVRKSNRALLDAFASYKYSKDITARLVLSNLLAQDERQTTHYQGTTVDERTELLTSTFRTVRLTLDIKL